MAINPGSDLLADALAAADPQRAKLAEDQLTRLALEVGGDGSAESNFSSVLTSRASTVTASGQISPALLASVPAQSRGNPYERFEATVLKSLFEMILPANATAVFGAGFAGQIWKSMLADSLANTAAKAGVGGIARSLEERQKKLKAVERLAKAS